MSFLRYVYSTQCLPNIYLLDSTQYLSSHMFSAAHSLSNSFFLLLARKIISILLFLIFQLTIHRFSNVKYTDSNLHNREHPPLPNRVYYPEKRDKHATSTLYKQVEDLK